MIDWILRHKANTIVYIFYTPWILFAFYPLTPLYGDISRLLIPVFFIFWIQMILYYVFTIFLGERLIKLDNGRFTNTSLTGYTIHSIINLFLFSIAIAILIIKQIEVSNPFATISIILVFTISELLRAGTVTNLIVNLEYQRKVPNLNKISTYYLVINPLLGLWNLHSRLKRIILKK